VLVVQQLQSEKQNHFSIQKYKNNDNTTGSKNLSPPHTNTDTDGAPIWQIPS